MRPEEPHHSPASTARRQDGNQNKLKTVDEVAVMFQNCVGIGTEFFIRAILAEVSPFDAPRTVFLPNKQGKPTEYCDVALQLDIARAAKRRIAQSQRYKKRTEELSAKIDLMIESRLRPHQ